MPFVSKNGGCCALLALRESKHVPTSASKDQKFLDKVQSAILAFVAIVSLNACKAQILALF